MLDGNEDSTCKLEKVNQRPMVLLYQLVVSIGIVALSSGCVLHPEANEIPGTYVAVYDFGTDSLSLKSDGTYMQEIRVKGKSEVLRVSGLWKYDQDESRINLSDVYLIPNPYSNDWDEMTATNRGGASFPVERYFFSRKLRFGPDEGHPHNKA